MAAAAPPLADPSGESGLTLVELLAAMSLFIVVLGVTLGVLTGASRSVRQDTVRSDAVTQAQSGMGRMIRELRATYDVIDMTGSAMDVYARLNNTNVRLRYDCDVAGPDDPANAYDQYYRRCVRRTAVVTDPTSTTPPTLPALTAGTVILDRICPGTSATTCDSAAAAPVFTCRASITATPAACAQLPPPPPDPDYPVDPTDPPPDPVWPTLVQITAQVPARGNTSSPSGSHRISFSDGVLLRNLDLKYANAN